MYFISLRHSTVYQANLTTAINDEIRRDIEKLKIELWSEQGSFYTDKIFSKPENYKPIYRTRDINGNESIAYGDTLEQFKEMFYNFYNMFDSPKQIVTEYDSILARARVMDEIVRVADLNRK